ncbi:MAG: hypothetical protein JXB62_08820 [Pirellulales bacterium]|nr:hypothetical protein [Pirellulales bacterium]
MSLFAQSQVLTGAILAVLALTTVMFLIRGQRSLRRQKKDDAALLRNLKPDRTDRGHHLDAPGDVLRWEVQMHETARELSAQLDSKMSALQALTAEADRAAARLEAALASVAQASGASPTSPQKPANQAAGLRPRDDTGPATAAAAGAGQPASQERRERIYTLADYGYDPAEIARRVGSPIGEVELILGLRGKH